MRFQTSRDIHLCLILLLLLGVLVGCPAEESSGNSTTNYVVNTDGPSDSGEDEDGWAADASDDLADEGDTEADSSETEDAGVEVGVDTVEGDVEVEDVELDANDDVDESGDTDDEVSTDDVEEPNEPPQLSDVPLYRLYPGFGVELTLSATDPEGDPLEYLSDDLPEGATLDSATGVLRWTPTAEQLGPFTLRFTVSDGQATRQPVEGAVFFQVVPLHDCVTPRCDPAAGCTFEPRPLGERCCQGEAQTPVEASDAPCPQGGILHAGQAAEGFGRLRHCSTVEVSPSEEGDPQVVLNLETRCVATDAPNRVITRLETAEVVLFDQERELLLSARPDGYDQALGVRFELDPEVDLSALEGQEALLTSTVIGTNGLRQTQALRLTLALRDLDINHPPALGTHGIYRAYPGFGIELPLSATDPEGDPLEYLSDDLPEGATLDSATGVLRWTPTAEQLGPFTLRFTVSDGGAHGTSEGLLFFQILPDDACVTPVCEPATGCVFEPVGLDASCCNSEPEVRVGEPDAPCPEGGVVHVGRNRQRGFGRLQSCDQLPLVSFPQGGTNTTVHVEARCVNAAEPVDVYVRLEAADRVLLDTTQTVILQTRPDRFSQALGLTFRLALGRESPFFLEGQEGLLTVTMTDSEGVSHTRHLRLTLTLGAPPDLPNADRTILPAGEAGCVGCHRPTDPQTNERVGIEDPHPAVPLSCVDCHGGDNEADTFEGAHVFPGVEDPDFIKNLPYDKLNAIPLEYIRFVNPGDFRVAAQSCGASSPSAGGTGCHQSIIDTAPTSVMSTYAGHYKLPRFMVGSQDREASVAAVDIEDPFFDPDTAPLGAVEMLEALREPPEGEDRSSMAAAMDIYLPKSCPTCHLSDFGPNDAPGKFRSSGCTACHMVYAQDGISQSADPAIPGFFPPHPVRHELTTAIPTEQCAHCHFQGGRIGLSYQGIREGGFSAENTPPNARPVDQSIYGHAPGYYFTDEDTTNNVDETPPDLHFAAGMACADCHVGGDVHGDGAIYGSERDQVGIRCEDCHGTVRAAIEEDPEDGFFKNSKGAPLRRLRREGGLILLDPVMGGQPLVVTQIYESLQQGFNPWMTQAMGVTESGFAHSDEMECYTCHNAWRPTCFGCHVTVNDNAVQLNLTTGEVTQGGVTVSRDDYSINFFALGVNARGKISPLCSSMSVFMSYFKDGAFAYRDRVRTTAEGTVGFGWNPFHHHTTTRTVPMDCDSCHPVGSLEEPTNAARLDETYGFGNGQVMAIDGDGQIHDLTAFLNEEGGLIGTFPHPRTGPVPAEVRERARSILVEPQRR